MTTESMWAIRAGRSGEFDSLFLKKGYIGLGWSKMGDLSQLSPTRDSFKAAMAAAYPQKKAAAVPVEAGQLYRFVHEVNTNDLAVYPSKLDRHIHIGRIESAYEYVPQIEPVYPHLRRVSWLKHVPRTKLSQGALYELGSAMTLFAVRNYAVEIRAILEGTQQPTPVDKDESIAVVAEEIEENTSDFILKSLAQELKGHKFTGLVAHLLNLMGYRTRVSPEGPDGGVDILAHRDELGFEPPIIKVQVKSTEGSVGDPVVSALYGKVGATECGLLVTLGTYTKHAKNTADSKTNLRLIEGSELVRLILAYYDDFDSSYKSILPLKRVFVPQVVKEEGE